MKTKRAYKKLTEKRKNKIKIKTMPSILFGGDDARVKYYESLRNYREIIINAFTAIITPTKKKNETKRSYDLYIL